MMIEGDISPFRGGVCAASHSCHTFCDVGNKTSMLRRNRLISYSFSKLKWDPPDGTAISRDAGGSPLYSKKERGLGVRVRVSG